MSEHRINAQELQGPEEFIRFHFGQRVEHFLLMTAFTALCVTGVPQHFYGESWASSIVNLLGGIETVRVIHRFFAAILVIESFYHAFYVMLGTLRGKIEPHMVPKLKDFIDALDMLKYSIGVAPEHPKFDRYDYRQKFEYWGLVLGNLIMIVTGAILWFPILATRFLPGELVPAAKEMHGGEALLALLVITIWHLYSVHLSPVQFPGDVSIFTGKISKHKMIEEHPLEYARIMGVQEEEYEPEPDSVPISDVIAENAWVQSDIERR